MLFPYSFLLIKLSKAHTSALTLPIPRKNTLSLLVLANSIPTCNIFSKVNIIKSPSAPIISKPIQDCLSTLLILSILSITRTPMNMLLLSYRFKNKVHPNTLSTSDSSPFKFLQKTHPLDKKITLIFLFVNKIFYLL